MYAKQNSNKVSLMADMVKNLNFFRMKLATNPYRMPMPSDPKLRARKLPRISKGVTKSNSSPSTNYDTVLKRMIATASLTIPSPKTNENS